MYSRDRQNKADRQADRPLYFNTIKQNKLAISHVSAISDNLGTANWVAKYTEYSSKLYISAIHIANGYTPPPNAACSVSNGCPGYMHVPPPNITDVACTRPSSGRIWMTTNEQANHARNDKAIAQYQQLDTYSVHRNTGETAYTSGSTYADNSERATTNMQPGCEAVGTAPVIDCTPTTNNEQQAMSDSVGRVVKLQRRGADLVECYYSSFQNPYDGQRFVSIPHFDLNLRQKSIQHGQSGLQCSTGTGAEKQSEDSW